MMDTGIAQRLRAAGIPVVEVAGWQTRGSSSFDPRGSVNHHTAGPSSGATPSLNTCIYGRPDLAGPLCNVFQSREPDGDDVAYVVAAGRANHAGEGAWRGLSGNSSVYGLEVEHTGTSEAPRARLERAAAIHAAMFSGDVGYCCQHREWTSRKVDFATNVDGDWFRQLIADARKGESGDWLSMASLEDVKTAVRQVLNEGTAKGYTSWAASTEGHQAVTRDNYNLLTSVRGTVESIAEELGTPSTALAGADDPDPERD
jgi:hypothetical protein